MRGNSNNSRPLAYGAICSALAVLLQALSNLFASLDLTLAALCALLIYVLLLEFGKKTALIAFLSSGLLSVLILPAKSCTVFYLFFFGWYPFLRAACAHLGLFAAWVAKLSFALAAGGVFYLLFACLFPMDEFSQLFQPVVIVLFIVAFVLYEIGLGRLLLFYQRVLRPKIFKA